MTLPFQTPDGAVAPVAAPSGHDTDRAPAPGARSVQNGSARATTEYARSQSLGEVNTHTALAEPLLSFVVRGQPAAQGSKRGYVVNGHVNVVEDGKRTRPWRDTVKNAAVDAMERKPGCFPIAGPVALHATFYLARPKGHYRTGRNAHLLRDSAPTRPTTKPDGDKMLRLVCDSLKDAGAYRDDAQVVDFSAHKRYADSSHLPGVVILLRPLEVASC